MLNDIHAERKHLVKGGRGKQRPYEINVKTGREPGVRHRKIVS